MFSRTRQLTVSALIALTVLQPRAEAPSDALQGMSFLVGSWVSDDGQVSDTGGTSKGASTFTSEAAGTALLRRDHTDLFDKSGKATGGFDQLMMIYADGPATRADYVDGSHVIHYVSAKVTPNKAVTFSTAEGAGPLFRLTYEQTPSGLKVIFGMVPPGQIEFHQIATGTLHRR